MSIVGAHNQLVEYVEIALIMLLLDNPGLENGKNNKINGTVIIYNHL